LINKKPLGIRIKDVNKKCDMNAAKCRIKKTQYNPEMMFQKLVSIFEVNSINTPKWISELSGQYFLFRIAEELNINLFDDDEYCSLLQKIVDGFRQNFVNGNFEIAEKRNIVNNFETKCMIDTMFNDDNEGNGYAETRHAAIYITDQTFFRNYLYGLTFYIGKNVNTPVFSKIYEVSLQGLMSKNAIDKAGGWKLYRLPWLTSRILINLKDSFTKEDIKIKKALRSLLNNDRFTKNGLWKSGVSVRISDYESTALCLEALSAYDEIESNIEMLKKTFDYLLVDSLENWINQIDFIDEEKSNISLGVIMLSSVLCRIITKHKLEEYDQQVSRLKDVFVYSLNSFLKQGVFNIKTLQYNSIPTMLYYILIVLKEDLNDVEQ